MKSFDPATTAKLSHRGRGRIFEMPNVADDAYSDGKTANKTIADLRRLKKSGKPFFLACGFIRPHLPFYAPKKYWDLYDRNAIEIADNRRRPENAPRGLRGSGEFRNYHLADYEINSNRWHRMMRHGYFASTSYVDQLVGDVLGELDRLGMVQNTIIVIWGDHGWNLGEHDFWGKHNMMHPALRVPLIVRVPGHEGARSDALLELVDLFPTLCDLAGLSVPNTVQGRSFAHLLEDPSRAFREVIYSRYKNGDSVVTDRFAYTRYRNDGHMLYDLRRDPGENHNVAADPAYRKTVEKMKQILKIRMKQAASLRETE